MAKKIYLGQIKDAQKDLKTEILFNGKTSTKNVKNQNKEIQIAFYLTREDAAKLNIIHARLQAESGESISRADRVRNLVLKFINEKSNLL